MTDKLRAHVELMQDMAMRYLIPEPYSDFHEAVHPNNSPDEKTAFIADMIHMLDGPEQRAAMAEPDLYAQAAGAVILGQRAYITNDKTSVTIHFRTPEMLAAAIKTLQTFAPADTKTGVKRGRAVGMPPELGMGYEPITPAIVPNNSMPEGSVSLGLRDGQPDHVSVGRGAPRK